MNGVRRQLFTVVMVLACAGCSQTAALAPVGGAELGNLRYAVNDVLFEQGIEILVAPVCSGTARTSNVPGRQPVTRRSPVRPRPTMPVPSK